MELLKDIFADLGYDRKALKTVYFNINTEYESYQDREPASYNMDIEPDDIDMADTVTVVWNIA